MGIELVLLYGYRIVFMGIELVLLYGYRIGVQRVSFWWKRVFFGGKYVKLVFVGKNLVTKRIFRSKVHTD